MFLLTQNQRKPPRNIIYNHRTKKLSRKKQNVALLQQYKENNVLGNLQSLVSLCNKFEQIFGQKLGFDMNHSNEFPSNLFKNCQLNPTIYLHYFMKKLECSNPETRLSLNLMMKKQAFLDHFGKRIGASCCLISSN